MYSQLKTDDIQQILEAARKQIESGVAATMVYGRDDAYYTLAINTGGEEDATAGPVIAS